ncbi:hypothetical protein GCM10025881_25350 [Pseudolysinimonas kribbensis]|uniref:GNAT family N-acetyltransferase n=1 Tax=Pseudolysinimonas kribbensis TaxID=433641 RepID=A0ABQ6K502_9MICO|nr:hypothetical protein GCM10025881_25350 [Pseudolysinimonas kribbensis]
MTVLRRAEASDLDAIMAIERASYPDDAWSTSSMRAELSGPHGYYLVAVDESGDGSGAGIEDTAGCWRPRDHTRATSRPSRSPSRRAVAASAARS